MKNVLVPVADGSEEIETITIVDVLRRAKANVTIASVHNRLQVTMAHDVKLIADVLIENIPNEKFDLIVLPGGMPGAENLRDCDILTEMLKIQKADGRFFGAICASPVIVLEYHGLLEGLKATCYPSMTKQLKDRSKADQNVVIDDNCITSQGPGTALEFSLQCVKLLSSETEANRLKNALLVKVL